MIDKKSNITELILKYPLMYRIYQRSVRSKYSEYDFIEYIFSKLENKKIRILDLCCGDSYVLNFINAHIDDYLGVDYSEKYLNFSQKKWKNFKFLKLDLNQKETIKEFKNFQPNFIFVNGAIHHLDDESVSRINNFVAEFEKSLFLSVDPISDNNKILNKLMIKFDRGKYIRTRKEYENLMTNYNNFIIDDFYKMSFKNIFHYRNFNLNDLYKDWKASLEI